MTSEEMARHSDVRESMRRGRVESNDDQHLAVGWRFDGVERVYENDAIIAFIDLLGTRKLYESTLPTKEQAEKLFSNLVGELDIKFCKWFELQETQETFDVSIFADSIVVSLRKRPPKIVERLLEFLLEYQEDLIVNRSLPSRAVLMKNSFFSFKMPRASNKSILGSPYTSISLCGGGAIKSVHDCLEGLPIGVYVTQRIEPDLPAEQRARIVPVAHVSRCPDLSFIRLAGGIERYLPLETCDLLHNKPEASRTEVVDSIKAAFAGEDASSGVAETLGIRQPWDVLKPAVQNQDALDKWMPWITVHLGKDTEIIRRGKS